jgi:23S rRNA (cytidine1920-2'-O)/16S rRNA (cytidine1409-2'-O)-methyltransferase
LRQDPRVVVCERENARALSRERIAESVDLVVCDASFIGLATVLPAPLALAGERSALVALVKPQFEAGRALVGKGGVVRDPAVHREVCERTAAWVAAQPGWMVIGVAESPILGPEGNREFLLYARRSYAER